MILKHTKILHKAQIYIYDNKYLELQLTANFSSREESDKNNPKVFPLIQTLSIIYSRNYLNTTDYNQLMREN